ncbi:MAG: spore coat associated protein CotJA [Clostridia bacterium]
MYRKNGNYCMRNACKMSTCCIDSCGNGIDALAVENTVPAGDVCNEETYDAGCMLAKIYFPMQAYRAGFRPCEALRQGTMFPELVRPFK